MKVKVSSIFSFPFNLFPRHCTKINSTARTQMTAYRRGRLAPFHCEPQEKQSPANLYHQRQNHYYMRWGSSSLRAICYAGFVVLINQTGGVALKWRVFHKTQRVKVRQSSNSSRYWSLGNWLLASKMGSHPLLGARCQGKLDCWPPVDLRLLIT